MPDVIEITSSVRTIAPKEAQFMLENNIFKGQRSLTKPWVTSLADMMKRGQFGQGSSIDFGYLPDGRWQLVNGQHRLHAVVKSRLAQRFTIILHPCETEQELRNLYLKFDRNLRRTPEQMLSGAGLKEVLSVNHRLFRAMHGAAGIACFGFMPNLRSQVQQSRFPQFNNTDARVEMVRHWQEEAEQYSSDLEGAEKYIQGMLGRVPIVALALPTYRYAPDKAKAFWQGMARDDGLSREDPRKAFLHYMVGNRRIEPEPIHLSRTVARVWTAWHDKQTRVHVQAKRTTGPIRIAGTPHTGKKHMIYINKQGNLLRDPVPLQSVVGNLSEQELFEDADDA